MENNEKSIGEKIVEMLCDGKQRKQIISDLRLSNSDYERHWGYVQKGARLPHTKATYQARKTEILANVSKWKVYENRLREMEKEYLESLINFDF